MELFLCYVFGAGYFLRQFTTLPRPSNVTTTIWTAVIFTAVMLWPIVLTIAIISKRAARRV